MDTLLPHDIIAFSNKQEALNFYILCLSNGIYARFESDAKGHIIKVNVEETLNKKEE